MNKYIAVCEILIVKDGIEVMVAINYKELTIVYYLRQGLKVSAFAGKLKRDKQTVYNTISLLKNKLNVDTREELKGLFHHIDFDKIFAWLFYAFIITSAGSRIL